MAEFSTGVTTLLARMDTNPSEFFDGAYKWSFINAEWVNKALTEAEQIAIDNKLTEVRRIAFDQMVMQTLLDSEAERESRLGLGNKAKMALQGSSLVTPMTTFEQQLQQQRLQNQYANAAQSMYPNGTGTATSRFSSK
jgi:hypothetical protein